MRLTKSDVREVAAARGWTIVRRCPSCEHERWRPVLRTDRDCCLAECDSCGLVFLNPRPPREADESGYAADHADSLIPRLVERGLLTEDLTPVADRLLQRYEKLIELTRRLEPTQPVLDLGCGIGTSTLALRAAGIDAVGMEIDPGFVAAARSRLGLDVRQGDVLQPLAARHPIATLNSVLEHIDDPVGFLAAIRTNALSPNGALVLTVPNLASTEFVEHGIAWRIIQPQHVTYFTEATLVATAERAGFLVEHVWEPPAQPRPNNPAELWARIGLNHRGNVTGGIGMILRSP